MRSSSLYQNGPPFAPRPFSSKHLELMNFAFHVGFRFSRRFQSKMFGRELHLLDRKSAGSKKQSAGAQQQSAGNELEGCGDKRSP